MMLDLINELWFLKRDIVSDDFDAALYRLAEVVPMRIHEYPTGERCWTWVIPEKWTCHEAFLETLDGERLIDYETNPLHVVSYSLPFDGIVNVDELRKHIHAHPQHPDAIPFIFKYYERDWGLCMTQNQLDNLTDDAYRVVIRSAFEAGTLKVGEVVIPGKSEECFVMAAHLCHPAQVNDDLTGVVVGLDAVKTLLNWEQITGIPLHYTYRLLILPETIGSVAYLSHNEHLIPLMKAGLFLEMLGNDSPHALQGSFQPDSTADRCMQAAFQELDSDGFTAPYRGIIDNDERQFNSPGVRVPMLSLSRVQAPKSSRLPPYSEYHTSLDTPGIVTQERLEASRDLLLGLINAWERDQYVVNKFKGEIFCSGYGIWVDYRTDPDGHRRLFEIMERCDGEHTVSDIAAELGISFQSVWNIVDQLINNDLVYLSRSAVRTNPR